MVETFICHVDVQFYLFDLFSFLFSVLCAAAATAAVIIIIVDTNMNFVLSSKAIYIVTEIFRKVILPDTNSGWSGTTTTNDNT